mgnify:CR=1 FL=1
MNILTTAAALAASALCASTLADFATVVIDYAPAPGQFVNNSTFNDPQDALGPPMGGGTLAPDNSRVLSLGGFGGSVTLGFDQPVENDPANPMGLDFIVFSNASWAGGNPNVRWAEAAIIEIAVDANENGVADDPWYLIPGSHLGSPPAAPAMQEWDNDAGTATPPQNVAWYPQGAPSPMTTTGRTLPELFNQITLPNPLGPGASMEGVWGYADLSPTIRLGDRSGAIGGANDNSIDDPEDDPAIEPGTFYTVPDDPFTVGIDPGSGGGDAFDIAWAIDPVTGAPANLLQFDFIRITNGASAVAGVFGELSPEIDAVADVRPAAVAGDLNGDGVVDGADLASLLSAWNATGGAADLNDDGIVNGADLAVLLANWTGSA